MKINLNGQSWMLRPLFTEFSVRDSKIKKYILCIWMVEWQYYFPLASSDEI